MSTFVWYTGVPLSTASNMKGSKAKVSQICRNQRFVGSGRTASVSFAVLSVKDHASVPSRMRPIFRVDLISIQRIRGAYCSYGAKDCFFSFQTSCWAHTWDREHPSLPKWKREPVVGENRVRGMGVGESSTTSYFNAFLAQQSNKMVKFF